MLQTGFVQPRIASVTEAHDEVSSLWYFTKSEREAGRSRNVTGVWVLRESNHVTICLHTDRCRTAIAAVCGDEWSQRGLIYDSQFSCY